MANSVHGTLYGDGAGKELRKQWRVEIRNSLSYGWRSSTISAERLVSGFLLRTRTSEAMYSLGKDPVFFCYLMLWLLRLSILLEAIYSLAEPPIGLESPESMDCIAFLYRG